MTTSREESGRGHLYSDDAYADALEALLRPHASAQVEASPEEPRPLEPAPWEQPVADAQDLADAVAAWAGEPADTATDGTEAVAGDYEWVSHLSDHALDWTLLDEWTNPGKAPSALDPAAHDVPAAEAAASVGTSLAPDAAVHAAASQDDWLALARDLGATVDIVGAADTGEGLDAVSDADLDFVDATWAAAYGDQPIDEEEPLGAFSPEYEAPVAEFGVLGTDDPQPEGDPGLQELAWGTPNPEEPAAESAFAATAASGAPDASADSFTWAFYAPEAEGATETASPAALIGEPYAEEADAPTFFMPAVDDISGDLRADARSGEMLTGNAPVEDFAVEGVEGVVIEDTVFENVISEYALAEDYAQEATLAAAPAEDAAVEEAASEDVMAADVAAEDAVVEEIAGVEEPASEDVMVADFAAEDAVTEDVTVEDVTVADFAAEDVMVSDFAAEDAVVEDVIAEEIAAVEEPAAEDIIVEEIAAVEESASEDVTAEDAVMVADFAAEDVMVADVMVADVMVEDVMIEDVMIEDVMIEDFAAEDAAAEDDVVEDIMIEEIAAVEDVMVEDVMAAEIAAVEEAAAEDDVVEDVVVEDVMVEDVMVEDVMVEDVMVEDVATEDISAADIAAEDGGVEHVTAGEPVTGAAAVEERATDAQREFAAPAESPAAPDEVDPFAFYATAPAETTPQPSPADESLASQATEEPHPEVTAHAGPAEAWVDPSAWESMPAVTADGPDEDSAPAAFLAPLDPDQEILEQPAGAAPSAHEVEPAAPQQTEAAAELTDTAEERTTAAMAAPEAQADSGADGDSGEPEDRPELDVEKDEARSRRNRKDRNERKDRRAEPAHDEDDPLRPRFAVAPSAVKGATVIVWLLGTLTTLLSAGLVALAMAAGQNRAIPNVEMLPGATTLWAAAGVGTVLAVLLFMIGSGLAHGVRKWWIIGWIVSVPMVTLFPVLVLPLWILFARRTTRDWVL